MTEATFSELAAAHYPHMVRTAARVLRNREDAEDATQLAFLAAWRNRSTFRGDASFSTWMTRITLNESLMAMRRRRRTVDLDTVSAVGSGAPSPEQAAIRGELGRLLRGSVKTIGASLQRPLTLALLEGLNEEQIAERLQRPLGTVKAQLHRGRQAVKAHMKEAHYV